MRVASHPEADEELEAAALWFEARQCSGASWPSRSADVRSEARIASSTSTGGPCAIVYSIRADAIYIKAVVRLYRRPFYWLARQPAALPAAAKSVGS